MRIVKAHISQKRKARTAFTLDSDNCNVVSGHYYVSRQGETYICLGNKTVNEIVIRDNVLLGKHIPVRPDNMVTLGELLTVQEPSQGGQTGPKRRKCSSSMTPHPGATFSPTAVCTHRKGAYRPNQPTNDCFTTVLTT